MDVSLDFLAHIVFDGNFLRRVLPGFNLTARYEKTPNLNMQCGSFGLFQ